jgi:hypothetical protein
MRYIIIALWDIKRKPELFANAPPIPACAWPHAERDGFPAYVDQPGPVRMIISGVLITLQRPIVRNNSPESDKSTLG